MLLIKDHSRYKTAREILNSESYGRRGERELHEGRSHLFTANIECAGFHHWSSSRDGVRDQRLKIDKDILPIDYTQ